MRDVTEVEPLEGYRLRVTFDDGTAGIVNVAELTQFRGVFQSLRETARFREVTVHPELKAVCWPGGADLDSDVLYSVVTGKPVDLGTPAEAP